MIILFWIHIPRKKPRKFFSPGYIRINNIHKIYEKHPETGQNCFVSEHFY